MTPLVVENRPPVTFLRRKMTGGRFSMGVVIRRYTGIRTFMFDNKYDSILTFWNKSLSYTQLNQLFVWIQHAVIRSSTTPNNIWSLFPCWKWCRAWLNCTGLILMLFEIIYTGVNNNEQKYSWSYFPVHCFNIIMCRFSFTIVIFYNYTSHYILIDC